MSEQPVEVSAELSQFVGRNKRFEALPPALKAIAIDTAQQVLGYRDEDLLLKAGEIDVMAISDEFAHTEQEANGGLIKKYQSTHERLLKTHSFDEARRIGLSNLRQSIASRMSRIALAKQLGYQPGEYNNIVNNPDFQAANDLSWQVVRDFQTRS